MTVGLTPRTPTAEDFARMRAEADEARAAREAAIRQAEARRIGSLAMIEPGLAVWSRYGDEPRGGVVVSVIEGAVDESTGEVIPRRFRVLNPYEPPSRWEQTLTETEVLEDGVELPDLHQISKVVRRLWETLAKGRGSLITPHEARLNEHAHTLVAVLVGGRR